MQAMGPVDGCGSYLSVREVEHLPNPVDTVDLTVMEEEGWVARGDKGVGTGIAAKMRAYGFQCEGLDTVDSDAQLGFGTDERRYEAAVAILLSLGYTRVDLMTNNPTKIAHLRAAGIEVVGRTPAVAEVTKENRGYLLTKAARAGHMIDVDSAEICA